MRFIYTSSTQYIRPQFQAPYSDGATRAEVSVIANCIRRAKIRDMNLPGHLAGLIPLLLLAAIGDCFQTSHHANKYTGRRSTSLRFNFFDKFIHPYGVHVTNGTDFDDEDGELLAALMPRTPEEQREELAQDFQRARLWEQLRLANQSSCRGSNDGFLADDEKEVKSMSDLFQRNRLQEQLRISGREPGIGVERRAGDSMSKRRDTSEAFQRALLEERLKSKRPEEFVPSIGSIEQARQEFETEREQHLTMLAETEEHPTFPPDHEDVEVFTSQESEMELAPPSHGESGDGGNGRSNVHNGPKEEVNQTRDSLLEMNELVDDLKRIVALSCVSESSTMNITASVANTERQISSLQEFVSSTSLPLPPKEDASILSLVTAPLAHLLSSVFLLGASALYAFLAVVDVALNDKGDCGTRACLRVSSSIWKWCWHYAFITVDGKYRIQHLVKSVEVFAVTTYYLTKCVVLRAIGCSKHSTAAGDAATSSLRYLVYAMRSTCILWRRLLSSWKNRHPPRTMAVDNPEGDRRWLVTKFERRGRLQALAKRISIPQTILGMKRAASKLLEGKVDSLNDADSAVDTKAEDNLRQRQIRLNQDRVALERDKIDIAESRRQLEMDRQQLQLEGVHVLAWQISAREAFDALEARGITKETQIGGNSEENSQKKRRRWWRPILNAKSMTEP